MLNYTGIMQLKWNATQNQKVNERIDTVLKIQSAENLYFACTAMAYNDQKNLLLHLRNTIASMKIFQKDIILHFTYFILHFFCTFATTTTKKNS